MRFKSCYNRCGLELITQKGRLIMKRKNKFTAWMSKYKHAWVFLYILVYLPWFFYLEKHVTTHYHVIQTRLDEWIPSMNFLLYRI